MDSQAQKPKQEIPEGLRIFLDSMSPPPGKGNNRVKLNWTILLLLVPYLAYLLVFLPIPKLNLSLFIYSLVLVFISCFLISAFKEHMGHIANPFDFVKFELINLLNSVVFFGFAYFFLSRLESGSFNQAVNLFDAVYFSFVTIATLGYGDIHPVSTLAKSVVILEIIVGVWFFVTIIPVAVADQAERLRNLRIGRQNLAEELRRSIISGESKVTEVNKDQ